MGVSGSKSDYLRTFLLLFLLYFLLVSAHIFKTAQAKKVKIPKEMGLRLFTLCSQDTQDARLGRISSGLGLAFRCATASQQGLFLT